MAPLGKYHVGFVGARMRGLEVIEGVGNAALGQWEEQGERAYHIRRRLSATEEAQIGPACDLRDTKEAQERLTLAWPWLPDFMRNEARQELVAGHGA